MINRLVFENFRHRPIRTLLSVLFIGLEVTLLLTIVGLGRGTVEGSARRAQGVGADLWVRPPGSSAIGSFSGATLSEGLLPYLEKNAPHVRLATGSVIQGIGGINSLSGIDLPRFEQLSGGFHYLQGGPFRETYDCIVDEEYARQNSLQVGDSLNLLNHPWRLVGIVEPGKLSRVFVPIKTLQDLTATGPKLTQIFLKLDDPAHAKTTLEWFKNSSEFSSYKIFTGEEFVSLFSVNNIPELRTFIRVVIGLSIVIGFLVVSLTMYTAVLERTREIGILKALGASPGYILGIIMRETVLLALLGTVAGVLMTFGTQFAINSWIPASMTQQTVPDWWPISAGITQLGSILGALYPGLKAARQDAIEALAYE